MRAVIQRVRRGRVAVEGETVGAIGPGLIILLGVGQADTRAEADKLAQKIAHLRIFADAEGKTNLSALDLEAEVLVISQFTLYANCRKGRRPSFTEAAPPERAELLVEYFVTRLQEAGIKRVETGLFGALMLVEIHNDGPVTIILDTESL